MAKVVQSDELRYYSIVDRGGVCVTCQRENTASCQKLIKGVYSPATIQSLATFAASMSFFSVSFYLAVYCVSLGLQSGASAGILAAFNASALIGEIAV